MPARSGWRSERIVNRSTENWAQQAPRCACRVATARMLHLRRPLTPCKIPPIRMYRLHNLLGQAVASGRAGNAADVASCATHTLAMPNRRAHLRCPRTQRGTWLTCHCAMRHLQRPRSKRPTHPGCSCCPERTVTAPESHRKSAICPEFPAPQNTWHRFC